MKTARKRNLFEMNAIYLIKIVHVVYTSMINRSRFTFIFLASRQIEEFTRFCLVRFILLNLIHRLTKRRFPPTSSYIRLPAKNSSNLPKNNKKIFVPVIISLCRDYLRDYSPPRARNNSSPARFS